MLKFKPILLSSIKEISEFLRYKESRTCDGTIGTLFMWREYYASEYSIYNDMLYMKVKYTDGVTCFTLPIGRNSIENALDVLAEYTDKIAIPLIFCVIPEEAIGILKNHYDNKIEYSFDRDSSDYLYLAQDLNELVGRRYSGQRNHINKFKKLYSTYEYIEINSENIEKVFRFYEKYEKGMSKTSDTAIEENKRTKEILQYISQFQLIGGFIEVEDNIIAFTIGEVINDTLYVHIEKALIEYQGSYQMIMHEFAKQSKTDSIIYINREEDTGDLGLRTSKLSYHPHQLLDKYYVTVNA